METAMEAIKSGYWIGQADMYNTLWFSDGNSATYIKNVTTKGADVAKELVEASGIEVVGFDPTLRGHGRIIFNSTHQVDTKKVWNLPMDKMPWGKYAGMYINEVDNTYSLILLLSNNELPMRLRANVRRRLIELGSIVRFEGELMYADRRDEILQERMGGHHFTNGERVSLEIKELQSFGYESMYGWVSIVIYQTKCGKVVKYKGSNPPYLTESDTEYVKVMATVKHSEYNGKNETQIQRIKVL